MTRLRTAIRHAGIVGCAIVAAVLVTALVATALVAVAVRDRTRTDAANQVDRSALLAQTTAAAEVDRYLTALGTVAGGVGAYERLTSVKFQALTASIGDARLAGVTSIGYVVPVADGQLADVQEFWRGRGVPDLTFKPDGVGREHLFGVFVRPLDGRPITNSGTDLSQSAEASAALNEARRSGLSTVSDTYVLLRDRQLPAAQQQLSFILTAPVYGLNHEFTGWILLGIRGQSFVGNVFAEATQGLVNASLWAENGGGQAVRVATLNRYPTSSIHREAAIRVANRSWTLRIDGSNRVLPAGMQAALLVVIVGAVVSLLLAGLLWLMFTGRARAGELVATATAELRAAERAARRQASLLNGILATISDGVGVVNDSGEFLVHNPAAKGMLGIDEDRAGPDTWQEHYGIFRPDGTTVFPIEDLPLVRALAGEATDDVEMVIRNASRPDGVLLSVSGRPLEVDGQRGAVAVFHDITAAREREADLAAFAGIVAHDLKNPLTVIAAHAEMAAESLDEPSCGTAEMAVAIGHAGESLLRVSAGVDRMRRLIDVLLAYTTSRDAPLRHEPVDLGALVADVVAGRTEHLRAVSIALPDVYVGPLPFVDVDPGMLRHVFDNLVGNALKYVSPGRTPKIDISAAAAQPGWVRIEVADRGIGVPDADKPRVFESFHRAHGGAAYGGAAYGGTGLGLAICRRIVDRHGGSIGVSDNPGGGSRFTFTLPLAEAELRAPALV